MRKYALNVSMVFTGVPFLSRFEAAATAGFEAVEFMWPSDEQLEGLSLEAFAGRVRATGLQVALLNFDAGDMSRGFRGLAGLPDAVSEFRANVPVALDLAERLGCHKLNALAGNAPQAGRQAGLACLRENLQFAAEHAASAGKSVMLEALNSVDFPDYLVPNSDTAIAVLREIDRHNVRYQLDLYHAATSGEDPVALIREYATDVGHVQFADFPGRHEPGTGELAWRGILEALDLIDYKDWTGLEYKPTNPAAPEFGYLSLLDGGLRPRSTSPSL